MLRPVERFSVSVPAAIVGVRREEPAPWIPPRAVAAASIFAPSILVWKQGMSLIALLVDPTLALHLADAILYLGAVAAGCALFGTHVRGLLKSVLAATILVPVLIWLDVLLYGL